jgi:hypothetical protein
MKRLVLGIGTVVGLLLSLSPVAHSSCYNCSIPGGCKSNGQAFRNCTYYDNTCEGVACSGVSCGERKQAETSPGDELVGTDATAASCKAQKFVDTRFVRAHPWIHDEALPVWLATQGVGTKEEVQELVHAFTGLQATIYKFTVKNGGSKVEGFTKTYSFSMALGKVKDVLTVNHTSGTVDVLTLFVDGTYKLDRTKN